MRPSLARSLVSAVVVSLGSTVLLACGSPTEGSFLTIDSESIRSEVEVSPSVVSPGGAVSLRVRTTNQGATRIGADSGCAPGLGFRILGPDGGIVDPYAGLAFNCPRLDSQDLEPGETDTVEWTWTAPDARGSYAVIGGLVMAEKILGPSARVTLEVR
jgi:hypothetical protein